MSTASSATAARPAWSADLEPLLERLEGESEALVARTEAWSAVNSGSYEAAGLERMRALLLDAFA
ncbi:MAG TPA: hypothetical protein VEF55_12395, partial [Candidatus Binatia bacterium]|nr:hypothetical protein [Candidatus Binatia bacterium]